MSISGRIRHRLVTVILLGVITSALSLVALVRVISSTTGQRVERGRSGVQAELARLAEAGPQPEAESRSVSGLIGMRGGTASGEAAPIAGLPPEWRPDVRRTLELAARSRQRVTTESRIGPGTLVVSAEPTGSGPLVWAGYLVPPPLWLRTWQMIVVGLATATALLVTSAIASVIIVKRGAAALNTALDGLANDLNTPVPRPRLRELSDVADGIARLAQRLARSRESQDQMGQELAMKDRLAALGRVVAGVAHEVRNPLASIKLRLDLAVGGGTPLPPSVEEAVAHATREIARLDRLVADLLVVASPGIGPRQSTSLGSLVRARIDLLGPSTDSRGVFIQVEGDASAPVDVDALARAIDNLVRNAVEASAEGAMVEIEVRQRDEVAAIAVRDHGAGLPAGRSHELFEPFFTTKPAGTGLGLAICRSIARVHGGDVTFTRVDGVTCVELTLAGGARARDGRDGQPTPQAEAGAA